MGTSSPALRARVRSASPSGGCCQPYLGKPRDPIGGSRGLVDQRTGRPLRLGLTSAGTPLQRVIGPGWEGPGTRTREPSDGEVRPWVALVIGDRLRSSQRRSCAWVWCPPPSRRSGRRRWLARIESGRPRTRRPRPGTRRPREVAVPDRHGTGLTWHHTDAILAI